MMGGKRYTNDRYKPVSDVSCLTINDKIETFTSFADPLPNAVTDACVTTDKLGKFIYLIGGSNSDDLSQYSGRMAMMFDVENSTWSELPPFLTKRIGSGCFYLNDILYVTGGFAISTFGNTECLDLSNTSGQWNDCQPELPHKGLLSQYTVIDQTAWLTGGIDASLLYLKTMHYWKKGMLEWARKRDMDDGHADHGVTNDGRFIYVIGGAMAWASVEVYDTKTDRWQHLQLLPYSMLSISAFYLPWGQIVVTGRDGFTFPPLKMNKINVYNITSNTWATHRIAPQHTDASVVAIPSQKSMP